MRCETISKCLDEFRTGELSLREKERVAAHLAECPVCSAGLAEMAGLAAGLVGMQVKAPRGILARVLEGTTDRYAPVETELGRLWVGFNPRGVTMVSLSGGDSATFEIGYEKRLGRHPSMGNLPEPFADAVKKAAGGNAPSSVRVDLSGLPAFEQKVLTLLRRIPRGEVRPYSWLAREAGNPGAVRAVGNTMAHNPVPLLLPCHRVVPASGGIGKYAFGTPLKRDLLMREGVPVDEIDEYARAHVRYIGCKSTNIYCLPTCRDARRVHPQNRVLLRDASQASQAGFRPFRHCKPGAG